MRRIAVLLLCAASVGAQDAEELKQLLEMFGTVIEGGELGSIIERMPEDYWQTSCPLGY